MTHDNKPSREELAWLLLHFTYPAIAKMYGTYHQEVVRWRDKYGIQKLSRKDRHRILNQSNFLDWSIIGMASPALQEKANKPLVKYRYRKKERVSSVIRAITQFRISRIIPPFVDCHHICCKTDCVNPDHIVLVPQQAHHKWHNNKIKTIPDILTFNPIKYNGISYATNESPCVFDTIPAVSTLIVPERDWGQFMINAMLVKPILAQAKIAETESSILAA